MSLARLLHERRVGVGSERGWSDVRRSFSPGVIVAGRRGSKTCPLSFGSRATPPTDARPPLPARRGGPQLRPLRARRIPRQARVRVLHVQARPAQAARHHGHRVHRADDVRGGLTPSRVVDLGSLARFSNILVTFGGASRRVASRRVAHTHYLAHSREASSHFCAPPTARAHARSVRLVAVQRTPSFAPP